MPEALVSTQSRPVCWDFHGRKEGRERKKSNKKNNYTRWKMQITAVCCGNTKGQSGPPRWLAGRRLLGRAMEAVRASHKTEHLAHSFNKCCFSFLS